MSEKKNFLNDYECGEKKRVRKGEKCRKNLHFSAVI